MFFILAAKTAGGTYKPALGAAGALCAGAAAGASRSGGAAASGSAVLGGEERVSLGCSGGGYAYLSRE